MVHLKKRCFMVIVPVYALSMWWCFYSVFTIPYFPVLISSSTYEPPIQTIKDQNEMNSSLYSLAVTVSEFPPANLSLTHDVPLPPHTNSSLYNKTADSPSNSSLQLIADIKSPSNAPETVKVKEATVPAPSCKDELCTEYLDSASKRAFQYCSKKALGTQELLKNPQCHFMNGAGRDPVGLVSVPGAGCTWLRGLLEKATGVCTGAIYCDLALRKAGFIGELVRNANVLVIKTHTSDYQWKGLPVKVRNRDDGLYGSAILLIRNPFDNFIAEHNRDVSLSHRSRSKQGILSDASHVDVIGKDHFGVNQAWDRFVRSISPRWHKTIEKWFVESMDFDRPVLVVRYEDLKNDSLTQVERILQFLNFPFDREVIKKRMQEDFGIFHRSHSVDDFEHYTPSQQETVNSMILKTIRMLEISNVEHLFNLHEYIRG